MSCQRFQPLRRLVDLEPEQVPPELALRLAIHFEDRARADVEALSHQNPQPAFSRRRSAGVSPAPRRAPCHPTSRYYSPSQAPCQRPPAQEQLLTSARLHTRTCPSSP